MCDALIYLVAMNAAWEIPMVFPLAPRRIEHGDFLLVDIDVKIVGIVKSLRIPYILGFQ